jgi:hypothetical protein
MATLDAMPLFQTGAAAGACGVLCDKYRMSTEGRLFPIIDRIGRRQPLIDEVSRMFEHLWETFILKVALLLRSQTEFWRNGDLASLENTCSRSLMPTTLLSNPWGKPEALPPC